MASKANNWSKRIAFKCFVAKPKHRIMWSMYAPFNEYVLSVLSECSWEKILWHVQWRNWIGWAERSFKWSLSIVFLHRKLTNTVLCFHCWREKMVNYSSFIESFRFNSWRQCPQITAAWQVFGTWCETCQWPRSGSCRHVYITVNCLLSPDPRML